jgi:hypothetical protein
VSWPARSVSIAVGIAWAAVAHAEMPKELTDRLAKIEAPPTAVAEVEAGKTPVWVLERDTGAEQITVLGIAALAKPPAQVADDLFRRDSLLESDTVKASGTFSDPAVPGDVARYRVPESDLEVLADCELQACKFKLGAQALKDMESIDWTAPDAQTRADALFRRRMVELVADYQKKGPAALGGYADKPGSKSVLDATNLILDKLTGPALETVRSHFRNYPKQAPGARDRLHWNVRDYGYRPVTSIVDTMSFDPGAGEPARILASETLYSSHYFYAGLQLFLLYADAKNPNRTYALYGDRMLFDEAVGSLKRKMLRSGVVADLQKRLDELAARYRSR